MAAVGAGQRIFFLMQAIMMAVSIGTTALVACAWGANNRAEANRVTVASLVLAMGLAGVLLYQAQTVQPLPGCGGVADNSEAADGTPAPDLPPLSNPEDLF